MMEKRNFVTSARTPMEGASDIDDVIESGMKELGIRKNDHGAFEKNASAKDEITDREP